MRHLAMIMLTVLVFAGCSKNDDDNEPDVPSIPDNPIDDPYESVSFPTSVLIGDWVLESITNTAGHKHEINKKITIKPFEIKKSFPGVEGLTGLWGEEYTGCVDCGSEYITATSKLQIKYIAKDITDESLSKCIGFSIGSDNINLDNPSSDDYKYKNIFINVTGGHYEDGILTSSQGSYSTDEIVDANLGFIMGDLVMRKL